MSITDILAWIAGVLQAPLVLGWSAIVLYLLFLTTTALIARLRERPVRISHVVPATRFTVLVPAHNEAEVIAGCLDSLGVIYYPEDMWQVIVVADNCTDNTAEIAREHGATVYERRDDENRGKGYALDWALEKLLSEDKGWTQAVVVLDADTQADSRYLRYMDERLQNGALALQGQYSLLDPFHNWRTALLYSALLLHNRLRPLARKTLGWTTLLKGNGMCFSRLVIDSFGWKAYGLAEDIEYTTMLLDAGIKVEPVHEAVLYALAPQTSRQASSQRMRWEGGRFALARRDGARLLSDVFDDGINFARLDWAMDLFTPPMAILVGLPLVMFLANLLLAAIGLPLGLFAWWWLALLIGSGVHVLAGLMICDAEPKAYLYLLSTPVFLLWKIKVYATMLVGKAPRTWVRTERTAGQG
jgi:1,2-diacylglycerol 3-beta-glucosyltransferase